MARRTLWKADDLVIKNEPLIVSLIKYNFNKDRTPVPYSRLSDSNLVSSRVIGSRKHMPIIDLDFDHAYVQSSTIGHGHLYLNEPISWWRWALLMVALRLAKATETGFTVWSLRRRGNFVRTAPAKTTEETPKSEYGWFRKLK